MTGPGISDSRARTGDLLTPFGNPSDEVIPGHKPHCRDRKAEHDTGAPVTVVDGLTHLGVDQCLVRSMQKSFR